MKKHFYCSKCGNEITNQSKSGLCRGCVNRRKRKPLSKETKLRISNALKGSRHTEETKKKISVACSGEKNGMFGKKHSDYARKKISESAKNQKRSFHSKYTINKMRDARIKAINEGRCRFFKDTKPELEVEKRLKMCNLEYKKQFVLDRRVFDFLILDHNILIEVDGNYWHCRHKNNRPKDWRKRKSTDKQKNKIATKNNFRLVRIWEDEIDKVWRLM